MTHWVALLRGVNVGGISIKSAELRAVFDDLGLPGARTVLASGNVAFDADDDRAALKARIERGLRERFDYDAWIILITRDELTAAVEAFPFDEHDERQPWVIFCLDAATRDELRDAAAPLDGDDDPVELGPGVVYWNPLKGRSVDTPFAKVIARAAYKARTTNRNLRTLRRISGLDVS